MMNVFAIFVGLISIVQFCIVDPVGWTFPKRLATLIILGAVSVLLVLYGNVSTPIASASSENEVAIIQSYDTNASNASLQQDTNAKAVSTPTASSTATPKLMTASSVTNEQPYNIYRSDKVVSLKRGKHYPYICNPGIKNCLGFTMKFSYLLQGGNYVKNVWLVCVRENGDEWVQVGEIIINEGEEEEFEIRFDRVISFTEIVIQRPIDYTGYMHTDNLSIFNIIYK